MYWKPYNDKYWKRGMKYFYGAMNLEAAGKTDQDLIFYPDLNENFRKEIKKSMTCS